MSRELEEQYQEIFERRHPKIASKQNIYQLIMDSYAGSEQFKAGRYLRRGFLEWKGEYEKRLEDSTYENFVQPANDTLTGLLYAQPVERKFTGDYVNIAERISYNKSIEEFMRNVVAPSSLMISGGVLVDSPRIDISKRQLTKKDQEDNELYPYAVYYTAQNIRDYHKTKDLEWILLDDSLTRSDDPFKKPEKIERRTLWTKQEIIRYEKKTEGYKDVTVTRIPNKIGIIPFVFCNWRDINDDCITETPFEDIAELNKSIYNIGSLITESAFQSSFSQLVYQGDEQALKKIIEAENPGGLSIIPVSPDTKIQPYYLQRPLANIAALIELEQGRISRIFAKIGFGNSSDKTINIGWKSRQIEFEKAEAILRGWASNMEKVEKKIFEFYSKWDRANGTYHIKYPQSFQTNTVVEKIEALKEILLLPLEDVKRRAVEAELLKIAGIEVKEVETNTEFDAKKQAQKITGTTPPAQEHE